MPVDRTAVSIRLSQGAGALAAVIGAIALAGWAFDHELLKAVHPGGVVMKTNSAISVLAAGLSLICLAPVTRSRRRTSIGTALALFVFVIGGLTFFEHLTGRDLGIDQLLFTEVPGSPATMSPNRMGPPASLAFPLLGIALILLGRTPPPRAPWHSITVVVMVIALVPLLGYLFGVREMYGLARYTGVALHTAAAFMLLALGLLVARPDAGLMQRLLANDSGGLLLRRLVPAAIAVPILLFWLGKWGERAGLFEEAFGHTLMVLGFILAFSAVVWWTAMAVHRHAVARARAEAAEKEMHARLMATLESERNARAIAERSNRMKDEFLATLSHELRTPLNAILGWIQLLVHEGASERDARRGLEAIERNSKLLVQLIEDLLDMSRIELGRVRLDVQRVDLNSVIDATLAAAAPAAAAKSVTLERRLDANVDDVQGDPARLQQVLWNLVSNAIKFTPSSGRVIVALRRASGHVELSVTDSGIGIEPEFLSHVFDRFRQADSSTTRRFGGLGLGLSIARQLTELHGGSLMAESEGRNRGATFTVRLPVAPGASTTPVVTAAPATPAAGLPHTLGGARVLLVDDQPEACEQVERILRERAADVTTAPDVTQAVACLEEQDFDVVVSDVGMLQRDGYDLLRHVRERHGRLPVVGMTTVARRDDSERLSAVGFDRHLPKPISADRLVRVVAELMRK